MQQGKRKSWSNFQNDSEKHLCWFWVDSIPSSFPSQAPRQAETICTSHFIWPEAHRSHRSSWSFRFCLEAKMPWSYKKEVVKSYNCPTLHLRISLVAECCSNSEHHWRASEQHQRNPEAQTMQQKLDLHAQCIVNHLACRPQGCRRPWHVWFEQADTTVFVLNLGSPKSERFRFSWCTVPCGFGGWRVLPFSAVFDQLHPFQHTVTR